MGIEEVFIDPCPGCEDVVPGIVTPGGPPSPPLTRRWGASKKKYFNGPLIYSPVEVHGPLDVLPAAGSGLPDRRLRHKEGEQEKRHLGKRVEQDGRLQQRRSRRDAADAPSNADPRKQSNVDHGQDGDGKEASEPDQG